MAFNLFAFLSVLFFLLAVAGGVAYGVVIYQKNTLQVGDLVRTTFTASPAVLTTALFGVNGEYGNTVSYGYNFQEDATNALHCDMPKGKGTFSTWLSAGGQNFKTTAWATNSQQYILQGTCTTNADCSLTTLQCGPGYYTQNPAGDVNQPQALWYPDNPNPAFIQCPGNSYCSICGGPPPEGATIGQYCPNPTAQIGTCLNVNQGSVSNGTTISYECVQPYSSVTQKYCAVRLPTSTNVPPLQRLTSCTSLSDYANTQYIYNTTLTGTCNQNLPNEPYFCNFEGNPMCLPGQQCVTNWSSLTGWCTPNGGCANLQTASNVCSGTVYPNTTIKSTWIAEGIVQSINTNSTFNIQWNRVQNTYPGIGPSDGWCNKGTGNCSSTVDQADYDDRTWIYSDCRFVVGDNPVTSSRHSSVTRALLGSSTYNPLGLSIFSTTDASFSSWNLQSLLYVATSNTGTLQNNWSQTNATPYRRTAWNLKSVNVSKNDLEKIFFYSIHPMTTNNQTVGWHTLNYA